MKHFKLGNIDFKIQLNYFENTILNIVLLNNTIENYAQFESVCKMFFEKFHPAKIVTRKKDRKVVYNYQDFLLTDESATCQLLVEDRRIEINYYIKNSAKGPSLNNPVPVTNELTIKYVDVINEKKYLIANPSTLKTRKAVPCNWDGFSLL